ncbi:MAG: M15 family metallopeptidase [Cellvibrionaceae bacterium]
MSDNVKRRDFLAGVFAGTAVTAGSSFLWTRLPKGQPLNLASVGSTSEDAPNIFANPNIQENIDQMMQRALDDLGATETLLADLNNPEPSVDSERPITDKKGLLKKVRNFNSDFSDDIFLPESFRPVLDTTLVRLGKVQKLVGHGHFNLISFDEVISYAKRYDKVGAFTKTESNFMEEIFFTDANNYGFYGDKVDTELTRAIAKRDVQKIPYSGHYLFKGEALQHYKKLQKDVGNSIILTSGIRSNMKQMMLFLSKAKAVNYNLSRASRSLAPPGHSYHGIGDYDVGRVGWGYKNFTGEFSKTDEFKRMQDLGYVKIRYTRDNNYGVRFEPWHIKVV